MLLRHDDTMIAVETAPAIVDYADILEATEIVLDEHYGAPWEHCDSHQHEAGTANHSDRHNSRMQGFCYCDGRQESIVITLPDDEDYGIYQWQRERGATRQVAREVVAADRRRTLVQLVEWYSNGWQWFGVKCDFKVLGKDFSASVWGIDDDDYARNEVVPEIAGEVADQLEAAGFTVTGRPVQEPYPSRQDKQTRLRYNLNIQNWKG